MWLAAATVAGQILNTTILLSSSCHVMVHEALISVHVVHCCCCGHLVHPGSSYSDVWSYISLRPELKNSSPHHCFLELLATFCQQQGFVQVEDCSHMLNVSGHFFTQCFRHQYWSRSRHGGLMVWSIDDRCPGHWITFCFMIIWHYNRFKWPWMLFIVHLHRRNEIVEDNTISGRGEFHVWRPLQVFCLFGRFSIIYIYFIIRPLPFFHFRQLPAPLIRLVMFAHNWLPGGDVGVHPLHRLYHMFVQKVFGIPVVLDVLRKLEKFLQNVISKKLLFRVLFFPSNSGFAHCHTLLPWLSVMAMMSQPRG